MFIVLLAVALFAALSYAVTRSSKGSQNMMTAEEANITASEIVEYGDSLRPIIDKMLLLNGLSDTNSAASPCSSACGIMLDPPTALTVSAAQELFAPTGGNAPYTPPPPQACNSTCSYVFSGQYTLTGVGSGTNPELAMLLVDIPQQVCQMINVVLNLGTTIPTGTALSATGGGVLTTATSFNGTNYGAATAITMTTSSHSLCYQESGGSNRYIYVNVVRAR